MKYMLSQWLLIFYTYCFLGWIWECSYVSIKEKEWFNRGFLHGPLIPIYGFGAVIILWLTLPFKENILYIYFLGSLGASVLEYFTGALMEKIFKVRYWDYSNHKYNLNGHISLFVSLGWGFFSVLLVKLLHQPIEGLVLKIPYYITEAISLILTIVFAVDATISIQSALDMKKLLKEIVENNKLIVSLGLKLNDISSSLNITMKDLNKSILDIESDLQRKTFQYKDEVNKKFNEGILNKNENLDELKSRLKIAEENVASLKKEAYKKAVNLLRKNPTAVSRDFKKIFQEIKSHIKSKSRKNKK